MKYISVGSLIKKISLLCLASIMFIGCSVKQDDSTATKTAKHLVNSPMYVVLGIGAAGTLAAGSVGYGVSKGIDELAGVELYLGETYLGKHEEISLDNNNSFAKFYTDNNFALYKDKDNSIYMLDKPTNDLVKDVRFGYKRKKSSNGVYFPIHKVQLEETGLDEEYIYSKFKKDRFDNPTFLGNNSIVRVDRSRKGWAMSMHTTLYLIMNGSLSVGLPYKTTIPTGLFDQIDYFYPPKLAKNKTN